MSNANKAKGARYRTRPRHVDAIQWAGHNLAHVIEWANQTCTVQPDGALMLMTPAAGSIFVKRTDWLVRTASGTLTRLDDATFTATYEPDGQ